jgi:hypothetical protein
MGDPHFRSGPVGATRQWTVALPLEDLVSAQLRRTLGALAALTAFVTVGMVAPSVADAHEHAAVRHTQRVTHHGLSAHAATTSAQKALRAALRTDCAAYAASVRTARHNYRTDPSVVQATNDRKTALAAAVTANDFLLALQGFDTATSTARTTLSDAIGNAAQTRWAADDVAFGVYDTATVTDNGAITAATIIGAREVYRGTLHTAQLSRTSTVATDRAQFETATLPARAQLLADLKAASDQAARSAARQAFWTATSADRTVLATGVHGANTAYRQARAGAALLYTSVTQQRPPHYILRGCGCGGGDRL